MSEKEPDFTESIKRTREEIPDWSDNKGFWSGGASTIEYKPNIDINKIEQHFGRTNVAKNEEFLLACRHKKDYEIGFTKDHLFFRSTSSEGFHDEPLGNVNPFFVKNVNAGLYEVKVFCIHIMQIMKASIITRDGYYFYRLRIILTNNELIEFDIQCLLKEHNLIVETLIGHCQPLVIDNLINIAKRHEKLLEFDEASSIYRNLDMDEEVIRVREEQRNKVNIDQNVVHGNQVTKTEIKDSVISKSNIASNGSSKMQELKDLAEMKKEGLISDEEYEKMKKKIIG